MEAAAPGVGPFGGRAQVHRARFDQAGERSLEQAGVHRISGALFDLGVSSPQLDRPERGFSYRADAPLDMRMDPPRRATPPTSSTSGRSGTWPPSSPSNGEARFARRIARAIVAARPLPHHRGAGRGRAHRHSRAGPPARGPPGPPGFQAVRIAVNDELALLPVALDAALGRLAPGGRAVVLSYHSGEDRIVKERFVYAATGGCICPPGLPCVCGAVPTVRLLNRGARKPTASEVAANPRAESARLRAVEALDRARAEADHTGQEER